MFHSPSILKVPPTRTLLEPILAFVSSFATESGLPKPRVMALLEAVRSLLGVMIDNSDRDVFWEKLDVRAKVEDHCVVIEITNRSAPLLEGAIQSRLQELSRWMDSYQFENLGRGGQLITLRCAGAQWAIDEVRPRHFRSDEAALDAEEEGGDSIVIRGLKEGEEAALTRLFHSVYGYDYVNDFIYFPERIRERFESGDLTPIVATDPDGRLLGHVGLVRKQADPPVYEAALGVVDPAVKSRGLFRMIFDEVMAEIKRRPMQYCLFDFVTNHDYTQRIVSKHGFCELSILLGCQTRKTQAKLERLGIGEDPKGTDRYSLLLGIHPCVERPFGKSLILPESIGETFNFLLRPMGISWSPASRFDVLGEQGQYTTTIQELQRAVIFDLTSPGRRAVDRILGEWSHLRREGYLYAGVDIPLPCPGLGQIQELLRSNGFFVAGFVPYHNTGTLGFRFQAIAPTKVDFSEIKLYTPSAIHLLEIIRREYERYQEKRGWV